MPIHLAQFAGSNNFITLTIMVVAIVGAVLGTIIARSIKSQNTPGNPPSPLTPNTPNNPPSPATDLVSDITTTVKDALGLESQTSGAEDLAYYVDENKISPADAATLTAAASPHDVGDIGYYVAEKKISLPDAIKLLSSARSPYLGEVAYYVAEQRLPADSAAQLLAAALTNAADPTDAAHQLAKGKLTLDDALKSLSTASPS